MSALRGLKRQKQQIGSDRTTVASTLAGIAQTVASEYQNISHKKISPGPATLTQRRASGRGRAG